MSERRFQASFLTAASPPRPSPALRERGRGCETFSLSRKAGEGWGGGGLLVLLALCLLPFLTRPAIAAPVDLALVMVADVSRSIDDEEFKVQRQGYAAALTDPKVIAALTGGITGSIAISYVEFSGSRQVALVLDWAVLRDAASARAFAASLLAAPRSSSGFTSISAGIDFAAAMLAEGGNGVAAGAARRVIDVSGDGTNNAGRSVTEARDDAVRSGIIINGLAIINDRPRGDAPFAHVQPPGGLANYYKENVIGGPGSFVLQVTGFATFAESMTQKLTAEIASLAPVGRHLAAAEIAR